MISIDHKNPEAPRHILANLPGQDCVALLYLPAMNPKFRKRVVHSPGIVCCLRGKRNNEGIRCSSSLRVRHERPFLWWWEKCNAKRRRPVAQLGGLNPDRSSRKRPGHPVHLFDERGEDDIRTLHYSSAQHDDIGPVGMNDIDDTESKIVDELFERFSVLQIPLADAAEEFCYDIC